MAIINTAPVVALSNTYKLLEKYVKTYIESGDLKTLYDWFETDAVEFGKGFEVNVVYSQAQYTGSGRAPEHGTFNPTTLEAVVNERVKAQYPMTISKDDLKTFLASGRDVQDYAGELSEAIMQGYIDDKNENMETVFTGLATASKEVTYTTTTDESKLAKRILQKLKQKVMEMGKNIKVSDYNTALPSAIQNKKITCNKIAIIMSCELASILDSYGYAEAFNEEYLKTTNVKRFEVVGDTVLGGANRILITDARNVILKNFTAPSVETIPNSDGSHNEFLNVEYYVDYLGNATDKTVFPSYLIKAGA